GNSVAVRVLDTEESAAVSHRAGVCRLAAIVLGSEVRSMLDHLPGIDDVRLRAAARPNTESLMDDFVLMTIDRAMNTADHDVRDANAFDAAVNSANAALWSTAHETIVLVRSILETEAEVIAAFDAFSKPVWIDLIALIRADFDRLLEPGFLRTVPPTWLPHLPRFLQGFERRLSKLPGGGHRRDERNREQFEPYWTRWVTAQREHDAVGLQDPALTAYRWMLEEYRLSLFAQELGTSMPISPRRLDEQWRQIRHRSLVGG
ncbi:MAG: DUF3418 domain-containing protein, partial [Planctomycetota bacterium]